MHQWRRLAGMVGALSIGLCGLAAARAQSFQEFPLPSVASGPNSIVTALDGNMYFTMRNGLAQITTAGGITEYNIPVEPDIVVLGSDGDLYFSVLQDNTIGRVSTASPNNPTFFTTPPSASGPTGLVLGPDGNYWFTDISTNGIGMLTPTGVVTEFPIPTANSQPLRITVGNDGNLWFTEQNANRIGRITPGGAITEFPIPTANSAPQGITGFSDGTIWFTEAAAGKIGQISTSGTVLQEIPTPTAKSDPFAIGTGPDGHLWIIESLNNRIGRIVDNAITEFAVPTANSEPFDFTDGPDGALWFTETNGNKIGKFNLVSNGQQLFASVLPSSRSPQLGGTPATAFATIVNAGTATATGCQIAVLGDTGASFQYQTTDPSTNALTGTPNTPVDIPAGASQTFVIALTPGSTFPPFQVRFGFFCGNANPAPTFFGTDTLQYSASATPVPDVVALSMTPTNDGILHVQSQSAFAVATANVGASGTITASATTGSTPLPLTLAICQTNPSTGACLAPPGSSVTVADAANGTPTFAIFGTGSGSIPFIPQTNRIFVQFADATGAIRGATSVAVTNTQ